MPAINHIKKELLFKLVYYGCGLGGKTTNLEHIHRTCRPDCRGKLLSLASETERTLFFDLLPVDLGTFQGYAIRLHLCTVPGQAAFDKTRRLILRGVDGIVFVVNSDRDAMDDNLASAHNLEQNLVLQGVEPSSLPLVVQFNKQDVPHAASADELRLALGIPPKVPGFEAIATRGVGVYDTLKDIVRLCLRRVGDPRSLPWGRAGLVTMGQPLQACVGALATAADGDHRHEHDWRPPPLPRSPRMPTPVCVNEMRTRALP